ncbi:MAG: hypothetical protein ABIP06_13255, partial [Pyrinomonadaceae bacterium]
YELLTGERPFKFESHHPEEVANIILTQEPIRPSLVSTLNLQTGNPNLEAKTSNSEGKQTADEKLNPKSKIQNY